MLQLRDVIKIYSTKEGVDTCALDNVNLSFGDRGMTFILGRSGSGKSTLLNLFGGLDSPTCGEIVFDGRSSREFTQADYDGWRNESVGFVFQDYCLISDLTVGQNVALALELQGKKADRETVDEALREVELVDKNGETLYGRRISELSGGQKQRVSIARALIKKPKLILADEPTGALDSKTGKLLYELLKKLSADRLVIIVTHDEESARTFGDRIISIEDGRIASDTNEHSEDESAVKPVVHRAQGKLPVKRIFSLGFKGLKHKTVRLVVTMLLTVVCLVALGFCCTFYTMNMTEVKLNTMKDRDWTLFFLNSKYTVDTTSPLPLRFNDEQMRIISEYGQYVDVRGVEIKHEESHLGDDFKRVEIRYSLFSDYLYDMKDSGLSIDDYDALLSKGADSTLVVNESVNLSDFGYRPDERFINPELCRMPRTESEIALTDLHFAAFKEYGYFNKYVETTTVERGDETFTIYDLKEERINIETPDDLIGLKLGKYTICGVYSTEIDFNYVEAHKREFNTESGTYADRMCAGIGWYSVESYPIVYMSTEESEGKTFNPVCVLLKFDGNVSKAKNLVKKLGFEVYDKELKEEIELVAEVVSPADAFLLDENVVEMITVIALLACIPLALFSILLFMSFLSVNIERRNRELGTMRALGASKRDVVGVCLAESFIIAAIDFAISLIALLCLCLGINLSIYSTMFTVGILPILAMFGASFVTAAVATVLPVLRLAKKKPVDILKKAN